MKQRPAPPEPSAAPGGLLRRLVPAMSVLLLAHGASPATQPTAFLPVGVEYPAGEDAADRQRDLEEMRRLRFNAVWFGPVSADTGPRPLVHIDRLLAGAPDPRVVLPAETPPARVAVGFESSAAEVSAAAWSAVGHTAGGVVFADWQTLVANPDALAAASQFAEDITRNMALYAPLRPVAAREGWRQVRMGGGPAGVRVALLESASALVLIAVNEAEHDAHVVMSFSPDVPEAIWQNMLRGGAVNFVASPDGPVYDRTFAPGEVLVLAIRTGRR